MLSKFKIDKNTSSERKNEMFVLLSLLHINGFINNASLHANFKNLREGKIFRRINSYHSKVNNDKAMPSSLAQTCRHAERCRLVGIGWCYVYGVSFFV